MRTTKRVVGLVMVDGAEEIKSGFGLVIQRQKVEEFCQQQGFTLVMIHHDTPYTNSRGLQRAAEQVSAGLADAVVYYCRNSNQPELLAA